MMIYRTITIASLLVAACGGGQFADAARQSISLTWAKPLANVDGTKPADLSGYRIFYGTAAGALTASVDVAGADVLGYTITGLTPGTYFVAVASLNAAGLPGPMSSVAQAPR
jgi:hypothetical protein